ncbi:hypothetical protein [Archaeoglobus veneficus]|uniref:Uncharacterized protein n=1 Tax=Archaeoglobus veneficus (strain DSM 11195 / SNP6) TaxID=693661 RepID=F2KSC4_ARCVS|nr:hypothetical protein [Archaeoglobus veneficus]AEA46893.1 hypothetical protein Arcve_0879 [Archaeoglobus veneficus SNP6]
MLAAILSLITAVIQYKYATRKDEKTDIVLGYIIKSSKIFKTFHYELQNKTISILPPLLGLIVGIATVAGSFQHGGKNTEAMDRCFGILVACLYLYIILLMLSLSINFKSHYKSKRRLYFITEFAKYLNLGGIAFSAFVILIVDILAIHKYLSTIDTEIEKYNQLVMYTIEIMAIIFAFWMLNKKLFESLKDGSVKITKNK